MADDQVYSVTIPPPVMGMSSKQALSEMDPLYSPEMENFFPSGNTVDLRKGFTVHATDITDHGFGCYGLFEYAQEDGDRFLVSAGGIVNYAIRDCTTAGAATDISGALASGPIYFGVNFGGRLYLKSSSAGSDLVYWTGTGDVQAAAFTGPGGDDKDLDNMTSYKGRLYFVENGAASIWYAGVGVLGSAALTEFDMTTLFRLGGGIWFIGSTSIAGNGIQEAFVVISEMGEILLYQGDYPGSTTWSLLGRYYIAAPAGQRSFFYWGQDVLVITGQGLIALSEVINAGTRGQFVYLSDEISSLFQAEVTRVKDAGSGVGFAVCGIVYPKGNYLLCSFLGTQWVMNLQTKAWTKFTMPTGQGAFAWALLNDHLYFSGLTRNEAGTEYDGAVFKFDDGYSDANYVIDAADPISSRTIVLRHAYNYFGAPNKTKQFLEARPVMFQSEGFALTADMDVDYGDVTATQVVTPNTADTAYKIYRPRIGLKGIGRAGSFRIDGTVTTKRMSLQATEISWKEGGNV